MNLLAQREHSYHELVTKLAKRHFAREEIIATLDELQQQRLLSDTRFSEMYVRHRASKGYGPLRIRQELQQRGVDEENIDIAMQQFDKTEWRELAKRVYRKKFGSNPPIEYKELGAQMRYLLYRGFSSEIAKRVLHNQETD
jgi:regulatory protein